MLESPKWESGPLVLSSQVMVSIFIVLCIKTQDIIDELEQLRSEIVATRQETRVLARLLGVEDQLNAALLEHQSQQASESQQQRRQALRKRVHSRLWSQPK